VIRFGFAFSFEAAPPRRAIFERCSGVSAAARARAALRAFSERSSGVSGSGGGLPAFGGVASHSAANSPFAQLRAVVRISVEAESEQIASWIPIFAIGPPRHILVLTKAITYGVKLRKLALFSIHANIILSLTRG
jgi:hypothetical protein